MMCFGIKSKAQQIVVNPVSIDLGIVRTGVDIPVVFSTWMQNGQKGISYYYNVSPLSCDSTLFAVDESSGSTTYSPVYPGYIHTHFHPTQPGKYGCGISITCPEFNTSTAGGFTAVAVDTLSGGYLSVNPLRIQFDTVEVGKGKSMWVTIKNTLLSTDTVSFELKTDGMSHTIVEQDTLIYTLYPGRSKSYLVSFFPSSVGEFLDTLIIVSNASQSGAYTTIPITATSTQQTSVKFYQKSGMSMTTYPNPIIDKTSLQISSPFSTNASIEIIDLLGRQIFLRNNIVLNQGDNLLTVDFSEILQGSYWVKCSSANSMASCFVIKY